MHILGLALAIVGSLLATTAGAQTSCAPDGRPINPYYENDTFADWPQEAQRFKNNAELVSRQRDRLRLSLDGGKSIELVDCPYGNDDRLPFHRPNLFQVPLLPRISTNSLPFLPLPSRGTQVTEIHD